MYRSSLDLGPNDGRDGIYAEPENVTSHVIYKTIYHMRESGGGDTTST